MNSTNDDVFVTDWTTSISRVLALIFCPIGIVSAVLTMCTLWTNLIKQKNVFFVMMFTISGLDLLFNITYIVHKWGDTLTFAVVGGITFCLSFASDLCAFALTLERYVGLCWPEQLRNMPARRQRQLHVALAVSVPAISLMRLQYIGAFLEGTTYFPESVRPWWWDTTYLIIAVISDMILPFVLSISMAFLSCRIISVVVRRYRSRAKVAAGHAGPGDESIENRRVDTVTIEKQQQEKEKVISAVSQVLILDAFFMLNQLGYCISVFFYIYREACQDRQRGEELLHVSWFSSDIIECMSHAFNFYFYVRFSSSLRTDFLAFVSRMKGRLGF